MRTYTITDPSGKTHSIEGPEGASREQVIAKIKERLSSAPAAVDPYTQQAQKQSVGENLLAGIGGGMTGLYLGAKQLLGKATPQEIEEHKQAMEGLRSTKAGTIGDIGGQIAAAVPAAFIPGANTYLGASLIGGGLGALQPTSEGESKAVNIGFGAAGGAAGKYVGDAIGSLIARKMAPKAGTIDLQGELSQRGIDYSKLSKQAQDSLKADADLALKAGKQLDPAALARKADFEATGIQPTLGQLTRDPMQFGFEQNTRGIVGSGEQLSQRMNEQNQGLLDVINKRIGAAGGLSKDKYGAGEAIIKTLKEADDAAAKNVSSLYDDARKTAGIDTPLNPHSFTNNVADILDDQMVGDALPGGIRDTLKKIATGEMPFTIQKAEQMRQAINGQISKIPNRENTALQIVNHALQKEIDSLGDTLGGQAGEAFKAARSAASQRFSGLKASPALKAATEGFEPNDFVDKFVIRAKPGDLMALRSNLQQQPDLWADARSHVVDFLKNKATGGQLDEYAKFSQSGFKNGLNSIGDARLKILFNPDEIAELKRIQRVAAAIQVQPTGSAVNNSGTSQAIANLLSRLSNVPYLKELAINPVMNFKMQGKVNSALNPNLPKASAAAPKPKGSIQGSGYVGGVLGSNANNY